MVGIVLKLAERIRVDQFVSSVPTIGTVVSTFRVYVVVGAVSSQCVGEVGSLESLNAGDLVGALAGGGSALEVDLDSRICMVEPKDVGTRVWVWAFVDHIVS